MHKQKFNQFTLTTSFSQSVDEMCHFLPSQDKAVVGAAVLVSSPTFGPFLLKPLSPGILAGFCFVFPGYDLG